MSKRTQATKPGDLGTCRSCNDYLVSGERGQACSDPACDLNSRTCSQCLVTCECGALICGKHRYEVSGLLLCRKCAALELEADDLLEKEMV